MTLPVASSAPATEEGLRRQLVPRQIAMMAMGGAIGVGLFLGSTVTIRLAGPGVILTYIYGAVVALIMGYALAEMAVVHPVAGSFGVFAERYLSAWAGFLVRATYAFVQILAIGAEVTAVAIYFGFWFPDLPQWVWVVGIAAALVAINTAQVGLFGELEYWFALIKVTAILAFILVGLALVTGIGGGSAAGFDHLFNGPGGFLPNGWRGVWLASTLVITSYMGVEGIAITAGEAERPQTTIPRAMKSMVFRLILFYVLAIAVMLMMGPWQELAESGGALTGSPFVRAFAAIGIPFAAGAMNVVVISAAVSSANTNLYMTSRMLLSLSRSGLAPKSLAMVNARGVPLRAVATASAGVVTAILLAVYAPANAFLALYGTAVAGMFFIWAVILLTYLRFRQALRPEQLATLPIRMPFHKAAAWFGLISIAAIAATTFFVDGLEYSVVFYLPFLIIMSIVYYARNRATAHDQE